MEVTSKEYLEAVEYLEEQNYTKSEELFLKNSQNHEGGYKMLSLFGLAESNFKNNKIDEMILNYKTIYDDENIDIYYRNLSRILSVIKNNSGSLDEQMFLLKPIINSPSKLQILAAELEVNLLIKFNKIKDAKKAINNLLNRSDISFEQKSRLELIKKIYKNNE